MNVMTGPVLDMATVACELGSLPVSLDETQPRPGLPARQPARRPPTCSEGEQFHVEYVFDTKPQRNR